MGVTVVGISADSQEAAAELAQRLELPFPLLSDPPREVISAFGVADRSNEIAVPAVFVVSRDGEVLWRYVGESPPDIPALEQVLAVLQREREPRDQ